MSLAIATTTVPGDLPTKLERIADGGFRSVELYEPDFTAFAGTAQEARQRAADLDLQFSVLQPFLDLEGLPAVLRQRAFDRLKCKLELIRTLGIDLLLVGASTHPQAQGGSDQIIEDLAELGGLAKAQGLRAAYMPLPWARFVRDDETALELIEKINSPNLGLALNSGFALADGSKPARLRYMPGHRLFHVQISDGLKPRNNALAHNSPPSLLPGQGDLNLTGFVRILAKNGYQGAWSCARLGETAASGTASIVEDGYRALVNLLDEAARNEPEITFKTPDLPPRVHASGCEFIEFAVDEPGRQELIDLLQHLCFRNERRHISKAVELWRQGSVNIVVNTDPNGFARRTFDKHGPTVCDMGLRVKDAGQTVERAAKLGAPTFSQPVGTGELDIPAIRGVGGSVVHFIDEKSDLHRVWDIEFEPVATTDVPQPAGLRRIDHVAQTMKHDEMQSWLLYYISTFEMEKTSVLDVTDPSGVVRSQAIASPEGEVRLNLNGAQSEQTLAGAFLADRIKAGVQHLAFLTDNIFETSKRLAETGFGRLSIPANYYADLQATFGIDDGFAAQLRAGNILYDRVGDGEYFQIYSLPIFRGLFFEIVERRGGYDGYGARNAPIRLAAQLQQQCPGTKEQ